MTVIRKQKFNDLQAVNQPGANVNQFDPIAVGSISPLPPAGSKSIFLDIADGFFKVIDENGDTENTNPLQEVPLTGNVTNTGTVKGIVYKAEAAGIEIGGDSVFYESCVFITTDTGSSLEFTGNTVQFNNCKFLDLRSTADGLFIFSGTANTVRASDCKVSTLRYSEEIIWTNCRVNAKLLDSLTTGRFDMFATCVAWFGEFQGSAGSRMRLSESSVACIGVSSIPNTGSYQINSNSQIHINNCAEVSFTNSGYVAIRNVTTTVTVNTTAYGPGIDFQWVSALPIRVAGKTGDVVLTKADVGLDQVDNSSDADKPISTATQAALDLKEDAANKGVADGYASLDGSGLVPASQLPSFVDDVLEFANLAAFPATGETGKIYVALDTNLTYRWSGSVYVELTDTTAVWGNISGDILNQTDLQAALGTKFEDPMTTIGDIIFRNGSNVSDRLAIGTNGQILTVVGGLPAYANPAPTGYELIEISAASSNLDQETYENKIFWLSDNGDQTINLTDFNKTFINCLFVKRSGNLTIQGSFTITGNRLDFRLDVLSNLTIDIGDNRVLSLRSGMIQCNDLSITADFNSLFANYFISADTVTIDAQLLDFIGCTINADSFVNAYSAGLGQMRFLQGSDLTCRTFDEGGQELRVQVSGSKSHIGLLSHSNANSYLTASGNSSVEVINLDNTSGSSKAFLRVETGTDKGRLKIARVKGSDVTLSNASGVFITTLASGAVGIDYVGDEQGGGSGGAGGLEPVPIIDDTFGGSIEQNKEYAIDISAGSLSVNLPVGGASERFKIAFKVAQITDGFDFTFAGQSGQQILFNGSLENDFVIDELTRVEVAWNGTQYVATAPWFPTYANLPLATATSAGSVSAEDTTLNVTVDILEIVGAGTSLTDSDTINMNFYKIGRLVKVWGFYASSNAGDAAILVDRSQFPYTVTDVNSVGGKVNRTSGVDPEVQAGSIGFTTTAGGSLDDVTIGHKSNSSNASTFRFEFTYITD